jgi:Flp pilus assembly protein TadB
MDSTLHFDHTQLPKRSWRNKLKNYAQNAATVSLVAPLVAIQCGAATLGVLAAPMSGGASLCLTAVGVVGAPSLCAAAVSNCQQRNTAYDSKQKDKLWKAAQLNYLVGATERHIFEAQCLSMNYEFSDDIDAVAKAHRC